MRRIRNQNSQDAKASEQGHGRLRHEGDGDAPEGVVSNPARVEVEGCGIKSVGWNVGERAKGSIPDAREIGLSAVVPPPGVVMGSIPTIGLPGKN